MNELERKNNEKIQELQEELDQLKLIEPNRHEYEVEDFEKVKFYQRIGGNADLVRALLEPLNYKPTAFAK